MSTLIFDIETDGLLDSLSKIHSLVIIDAAKREEIISCTDNDPAGPSIKQGLELLSGAKEIAGHNIVNFDIPAIKKLYPQWNPPSCVLDTLVSVRLYWPDTKDKDFIRHRVNPKAFPAKLIGRHSLEAWGYRLDVLKGDFGKTTDWSEWSEEMQEYCEQDVRVTLRLYDAICAAIARQGTEAIALEHSFAKIIADQERFGFTFDVEGAQRLYATLADKREELRRQLQEAFPPIDKGEMFTPKVNNKARDYVKGVPVWKEKIVEFNPASREHIAERLIERYGWKPEIFTNTGKPEVSEEILSTLPYPEVKALSEYLMLDKRIGQLAEGKQAWLLQHVDGVMHGGVVTNGTVTGRCAHNRPNIAQVPAPGSPYGTECRALFRPPDGYYQLGCDASGLELRCLAHYLARYDGGKYRDIILNGDIHTENQKAAGLETRAEAKRFAFGFLYGAGDVLLGSLVTPTATQEEQRKAGKKLRTKFLKNIPALKQLVDSVKDTAKKKGYLRGIDGRSLKVRSQHSALNLLLQSAGAIVMKKATVILWDSLTAHGYTQGRDIGQMAHIHDEFQLAVREGIAPEIIGAIAVDAIRRAGEYFNFRCPLDGEYKTGRNWAETH